MRLLITALLLITLPVNAQQIFSSSFEAGELPRVLPDAAGSFTTAKRWLYERVHFDRMDTFYCGCDYDDSRVVDLDSCGMESLASISRARRVEAEHVFPASQFGNFRACWREPEKFCGEGVNGRDCCLDVDSLFEKAHNDLTNLQPANGHVNGQRSNYNWGAIEGEAREFGACDVEIDSSIRRVEPPAAVHGDIARTYLYDLATLSWTV